MLTVLSAFNLLESYSFLAKYEEVSGRHRLAMLATMPQLVSPPSVPI
jgi:hypothetical protein